MCAVATIPLKLIRFTGVICVLRIGEKQYRLATYNGAHVVRFCRNEGKVEVVLGHYDQLLVIEGADIQFGHLMAPTRTGMDRRISESINARFNVEFRHRGDTILHGEYTGGLEMLEADSIMVSRPRKHC